MIDFALFLEYLKVVLWPAVAMYVIVTFQSQISRFLNRLFRAELPGGFVFDAEKQTSQEITPQQKESAERTIEEQTKNKVDDELALKDMQIDFERTYNLIYGSQLWLLHVLQNSPHGIGRIELEKYFAQTKQRFNSAFEYWDLTTYLQFLFKKELIEFDEQTQTYKITNRGITFLSYITNLGYRLGKPL